jgi:4-hydroxy-tetrahydrodipicolinate synthase
MTRPIYGGVNAAVLTPMGADLAPDIGRMAAHGQWLLTHGCDGLGILGTTGEAASFGLHERMAIVDGLVAGGIPAERMMPGTGCPSLSDTVDLTNHAAAAGCPGVLMLPPYYYKGPSEDGLFAWYAAVIERTRGRAKVYLYHFPQQSAVPLTLPLIRRLLDAFPGIVKGVKDSSGDYANMKAMIDAFGSEGFEVYSGSDAFLQRILAEGGAGCITAASNANCLWGGIVAAHRTGPEADRAQAVLNATRAAASSVPLIAGLREVIARATGDGTWRHIRPPNMPLSAAEAEKVWAAWTDAGALPLPGLPLSEAA